MQRAIALVDCNNFYVSCERLFQPKLEGRPVVILSNNDGCVVSRSQEAKNLGIMMAAPWFQLKDIAHKHDITALSSNYTLYADISKRVMQLLSQFAPKQEIYSIDESFLELTGISTLTEHGQSISRSIKQYIGIPVCVGIASSKTLAKLANQVAKKQAHFNSVCNFNELSKAALDTLLDKIEVGEVWGVGRRTRSRLQDMNIYSALDLKRASSMRIRTEFGVLTARTLTELNGTACLELTDQRPPRKQIICSRSFGTAVLHLSELEQAVIAYTSRAAEKLRRQHTRACSVHVSIHTNPHHASAPQYHPSMRIPLFAPTDDTRLLCQATLRGLRQIYRRGHAYQKAGIILSDLIPPPPRDLFDTAPSSALMATLDKINQRMGSGTIQLLGAGIKRNWAMRRGNVSQRYTTKLCEIAIAKA
ncbi:MAG: Y-family DNA polymerase [Gallionella sp.]